ncbi:leucyl aminopeptidase family protein [Leucothrix arctica]|uniref:Leucyl aminopeptidase n=1 Tax=Leucothrix arctica TaxID=1481894 RepID=A0A317CIV5_9GAMM|nr:leucyl aminopeptidase family protein [Leucothrix arctica]PWQ98495.1 leucyl aminopeptidase [Leucothrix arctica]
MPYSSDLKNSYIPITPVTKSQLESLIEHSKPAVGNWIQQSDFEAKEGEYCLISNEMGELAEVLIGVARKGDRRWSISGLPTQLPVNHYELQCSWTTEEQTQALIGWGLGSYKFDQFIDNDKAMPLLHLPSALKTTVTAFYDSLCTVRDLINLPANHMMPEHLSQELETLANEYDAEFSEIVGDDLLTQNFPTIHAVGRASDHAPRLLSLTWGEPENPRLSLVGKGVCFDTGGLDIKGSNFMRQMKKDMGGAAHVLGLAKLVMAFQLPVSLEVLVPAVDNAISGDAFRPGDVIKTRSGKTVEIDNTDAEGRLVLCDALSLACDAYPDLIIDFATLTGAARVALGTEVPVIFSNDNDVAQDIQRQSVKSEELIWQLPLYKPYFYGLESNVADMVNSASGYGGAISAALYLNEFVDEDISWAHIDLMAFNVRKRPGRPLGGEAMGLFAVFDYLQNRYPA